MNGHSVVSMEGPSLSSWTQTLSKPLTLLQWKGIKTSAQHHQPYSCCFSLCSLSLCKDNLAVSQEFEES